MCRALPERQPLLHLTKEASVELVDGVNVGEEQGHQVCRHGVHLDHRAPEPLPEELRVTQEPHTLGNAALTTEPPQGQLRSVLQPASRLITQFSQYRKTILDEKLQRNMLPGLQKLNPVLI